MLLGSLLPGAESAGMGDLCAYMSVGTAFVRLGLAEEGAFRSCFFFSAAHISSVLKERPWKGSGRSQSDSFRSPATQNAAAKQARDSSPRRRRGTWTGTAGFLGRSGRLEKGGELRRAITDREWYCQFVSHLLVSCRKVVLSCRVTCYIRAADALLAQPAGAEAESVRRCGRIRVPRLVLARPLE